jgi:hypothetical protein
VTRLAPTGLGGKDENGQKLALSATRLLTSPLLMSSGEPSANGHQERHLVLGKCRQLSLRFTAPGLQGERAPQTERLVCTVKSSSSGTKRTVLRDVGSAFTRPIPGF